MPEAMPPIVRYVVNSGYRHYPRELGNGDVRLAQMLRGKHPSSSAPPADDRFSHHDINKAQQFPTAGIT